MPCRKQPMTVSEGRAFPQSLISAAALLLGLLVLLSGNEIPEWLLFPIAPLDVLYLGRYCTQSSLCARLYTPQDVQIQKWTSSSTDCYRLRGKIQFLTR
jgi:hypothetical protein